MPFKKANRESTFLRMAISGAPGSGKTYSALSIATGLSNMLGGAKIAVIDTERGSGSMYGSQFSYDLQELGSPYTAQKYIEMIDEASHAGYPILIIDSISHCWASTGGILELHSEVVGSDSRKSFPAWRKVNPIHDAFVDRILTYPGHTISTIRSKLKYEIQKNQQGKSAPVLIGDMPIQRESILYEFHTLLHMSADNTATCEKDRSGVFHGMTVKPCIEMGESYAKWLGSGSVEGGEVAPAIQHILNAFNDIDVDTEEVERFMGKSACDLGRKDIEKLRDQYAVLKDRATPEVAE